ncbi:hypothetical protein EKD00_00455 [Chlorobium phaeovibrioides]|uniref:Uncharacterized protein n=1 Tax=Chlorobium phaeovibrioides TaxID=1094 RepID=A0A5M8ICP7_CHLPH|nr:hypothetical protein [Chlorobium phaeovibrioides]KAA6232787.1 hypothetical protein FP507_06725 [Chlorobium phaeovibrioides]MWV54874.1 hypothetical protein [Chlorobium phaeovibrioides]QEQ56800.1 hypothetical protein FNV82_03590 [Chlorobium phaeovibrioides]RTY37243.1 hypothetical protein EKD00_00455 [Chlorobium phaeovibrioides]
MDFLADTLWWLTLAIASCGAALPAIFRTLRPRAVVPATLIWAGAITATAILYGTAATLASIALSVAMGALLLGITIFFSGIKGMANSRYR